MYRLSGSLLHYEPAVAVGIKNKIIATSFSGRRGFTKPNRKLDNQGLARLMLDVKIGRSTCDVLRTSTARCHAL